MNGKAEIERIYSLTPMQEGMLFHSLMENDSETYFEQVSFEINGALDTEAFEKSFNILIDRHEVFRAIFIYKKMKNPKQVIIKKRTASINFEDISSTAGDLKTDIIKEFLNKDRLKGFDLSKDMPARISVLRIESGLFKVVFSFHHIIMDGWSLGIVFRELFQIYNSLVGNVPANLSSVKSFGEYIKWLEKQDVEEAAVYWTDYLTDYEEQAVVPKYRKQDSADKYKKEEYVFSYDESLTKSLTNIANSNKSTLNNVFLAIWGILLQRYNNSTDVVFGSVVSGRTPEISEIESMVGLFINTSPVRVKCSDTCSFSELVLYIRDNWLNSGKYDYYPLSNIQSKTNLKEKIINHIVAFENYPLEENTRGFLEGRDSFGITIGNLEIFEKTNYDLNVIVFPGDSLTVRLVYNSQVYSIDIIERIGGHLKQLAAQVVSNPEREICTIDILTEHERNKLLFDFNNTMSFYPKDKTIQALFEEQVSKAQDKIAVVFGESKLTYCQLNKKSNQLARMLREKGVGPDTVVGIMLERSLEMIIIILGILKAGGAYLPIDTGYPSERVFSIISDSGSQLLITNNGLFIKIEGTLSKLPNLEIFFADEIRSQLSYYIDSNLQNINNSANLAYVMYTSGSTGKPKGNLTSHFNITRIVKDTNYLEVSENDVFLQLSNYAFDGSAFDIFCALLNGGKLVLVDKSTVLNMSELSRLINNQEISVFFVTTALFNTLVDINIECFKNIRKVLFGGERVSLTHVKKAFDFMGAGKILHMYGPTESTVFTTYYSVNQITDKLGTIPIGKPLSNTLVYILDSNNNLQPIGVPGELCVSGDGLVNGYMNRQELTLEKFISNPFKTGMKLYKTGDLARWLGDGNIEFIDRIDSQVKLRGFRIELGEIEYNILECGFIREVAVILKNVSNVTKYLYAYYVSDEEVSDTFLREFLAKKMPDYMIPSCFIKIDTMPLNSNGKIDKKKLIEIITDIDMKEEFTLPTNETEEKLKKIWKDVLGIENIEINDDFFNIGGNSLSVMRVLSAAVTYNWNISIQDFYEFKTIRALSNKINNKLCISTENGYVRNEIVIRDLNDNPDTVLLSNSRVDMKNVLLTGATGYLGIHLLATLLDNTSTSVYCLIRGQNYEEAQNKLSDLLNFYFTNKYIELLNSRIFIILGDITYSKLDICEKDYNYLGGIIDTVIHSAAIVKHFGNYAEFEKINVSGTRHVIDFARAFNCRLIHISTMAVSGDSLEQSDRNLVFTENNFYIGQNYMDNVYIRSKFEAENIVYNAVNSGLDAVVMRVGNLTGRHSDGHFQVNLEENKFYNILKSLALLKAVPKSLASRDIEFTPIDLCSWAIVKLSEIKEARGKSFHVFNHKTIPMSIIVDVFNILGFCVKIVEDMDFIHYVKEVSLDASSREALKGIIVDFNNGSNLNYRTVVRLSSEITIEYLRQLGFEWPSITHRYIERIIKYANNMRFFNHM